MSKITNEVQLCKVCGEPIMVFLVDGEIMKCDNLPEAEDTHYECLPKEVQVSIDRMKPVAQQMVMDHLQG